MQHLGAMAAAAILAILPQAASATTYEFQSTETSSLSPSPLHFDFVLDTATAIMSGPNTSFSAVTIAQNAVPVFANTVSAAYNTNIGSPLFFLVDTDAKPFYSGMGTGIQFNIGSFAIADGFTDGIGTLTIVAVPIPAVPELSTWTFLFTGLGAIGAVVRSSRIRQETVILPI